MPHGSIFLFCRYPGAARLCIGLVRLLVLAVLSLGLVHYKASAADPRQREIMEIVADPQGFITKDMHEEFWGLVPDEYRRNPEALAVLQDNLQKTALVLPEYTREHWLSVGESLAAQEVRYSPGYEAAKNALVNFHAIPEVSNAMRERVAHAERVIRAAANGEPLQSEDGQIVITQQDVEDRLNSLEAVYVRVGLLFAERWDPQVMDREYSRAGLNIRSAVPFVQTVEERRLQSGQLITNIYLLNRVDALNSLSIQIIRADANWSGSDETLVRILQSSVEKSVSVSKSDISTDTWRGRQAAQVKASQTFPDMTLHASARTVSADGGRSTITFIARSAVSVAEADARRIELEEATALHN